MVKADGTHHKTLISNDSLMPRALLLHPEAGLMWWSDWAKKTIEKADMDGTRRKVIAQKGVGWVNGLTADFKSR